jgi:flagellar basal-body rod protein FlgB
MQLFDSVHLSLERALEGASMRHSALSENLANVNTPGYKRQDVDFHSVLQQAMPFGKDAIAAVPFSTTTDDSSPVRADGNSVDADVEASQLAQNALEYEAMSKVLGARDDILRSAMGVG